MRLYRPSKSDQKKTKKKKTKTQPKEINSGGVSLSSFEVNRPAVELSVENDDDGGHSIDHEDTEINDDDDDDDNDEIFSCHYDHIELPQPSSSTTTTTSYHHNNTTTTTATRYRYRYMTCDAFHDEILLCTPHTTTSNHTNHNPNHNTTSTSTNHHHDDRITSFYPGQNVWVCKSKGMKQTKKNKKNNIITNTNENEIHPQPARLVSSQQRYELFSRAIVVILDPDTTTTTTTTTRKSTIVPHDPNRILVQYPMGSTYHVRSELLLPIFDTPYMERYMMRHPTEQPQYEPHLHQSTDNHSINSPLYFVVVYPETHAYRRACMIHTDPTWDHFMEIGCAQGQTCYRIHNHNYDSHNDDDDDDDDNTHRKRRIVLGIDKSISCIASAQATYGHYSTTTNPLQFVTYDVLQPTSSILLPSTSLSSTVSGTSEMEAPPGIDDDDVQEMIQNLMDGYHQTIAGVHNISTVPNVEQMMDHQTDVNSANIDHDRTGSTTKEDTIRDTQSKMGLVVAIDINGNRHLEPILQCLRIIMNTRFTILQPPPNPHQSPPSLQPRLIIVKSRSLYLYLQQRSPPIR